MTLLRTGIHGYSGPGVIPVSQMVSGALGSPIWWNPDGATPGYGGSCVGAYRAIDTVGSPWGPGPADYAASLINLANPGVNNLIEGNGAVPWNAATGWGFVAAALQYFNTGLIPANNQTWSALIQFDNVIPVGANDMLFGLLNDTATRNFGIRPSRLGASVEYMNNSSGVIAPPLLSGNLCFAGNNAYRNGVADGAIGGIVADAISNPIYIGARALGADLPITANIESIAFYNVVLTAPQVLARATAMAAL